MMVFQEAKGLGTFLIFFMIFLMGFLW